MRAATIQILYCLPLYLATYASSQTPPPVQLDTAPAPTDRFPATWYPESDDKTYPLRIVKDRPFTAVLITTDRYESSGQIITHQSSTVQARDAAGRTHREDDGGLQSDSQGRSIPQRSITVTDPVSHCSFRWTEPEVESEKSFAFVHCMPRTIHYTHQDTWEDFLLADLVAAPKDERGADGSIHRSEVLGKRTFGDAEAEGMKHTATGKIDETGAIWTRITEFWYSRDICELVQLTFVDSSELLLSKTEAVPYVALTKIKRIEPGSSLFYPPLGFEIRPGDFN
jgi:hypothetical protein